MFIKVLIYWYSQLHCAVLWKSVLGETFWIQCGVRQGRVLSQYLFSLYVDDVISALRNSVYGIFVINIFTGCILYADDIILLSCSCYGLQKWSTFVLRNMAYQIVSCRLGLPSSDVQDTF